MRRKPTEMTVSTTRRRTNAVKNAFWSSPSLIRFTAAPPNPPSPIRLNMLK
jgi:hypothetical protein